MKRKAIVLLNVLLLLFVFIGCDNKEKNVYDVNKDVTNQNGSNSSQPEEAKDMGEDFDEASDINTLLIGYRNLLDTDIGMICIIDPVSNQQINVDALPAGETITSEISVPASAKELKWAIYNENGELYSESTTDITTASDSVWFILKGSNSVENIDVLFNATEKELNDVVK